MMIQSEYVNQPEAKKSIEVYPDSEQAFTCDHTHNSEDDESLLSSTEIYVFSWYFWTLQ